MKQLIIIGARGFGREVYNLFLACKLPDVVCKGFLDDKKDSLEGYDNYPPIISSVEDYQIQNDDVFVCALGDVKWKKHYVQYMRSKGANFISLIHPSVEIGLNTNIGTGCIIRTQASISCDINLGDFVTIMGYAVLGHDAKVGSWSHIGAHCFMGGYSQIGEMVTMHPGSRLLPHKKIENNASVGAGSVVISKVKEGTTVFGIPAKKLVIG